MWWQRGAAGSGSAQVGRWQAGHEGGMGSSGMEAQRAGASSAVRSFAGSLLSPCPPPYASVHRPPDTAFLHIHAVAAPRHASASSCRQDLEIAAVRQAGMQRQAGTPAGVPQRFHASLGRWWQAETGGSAVCDDENGSGEAGEAGGGGMA